jgi:DnaD/phage-associated family protein
MSIRIMTMVWDKGPEDKNELLVLLALADHANDDGYCWPSMNSIARKCRMTRQGVAGIEERLETDGWLRIYRSSSDGKKNVNKYCIQVERFQVVNGVDSIVNPIDYPSKPDLLPIVNRVDYPSKPGLLKSSINHHVKHQIESSTNHQNPDDDEIHFYESNIGVCTPIVLDKLEKAKTAYPEGWLRKAIEVAAENKARSWAYIEVVLNNWKINGFGWRPGESKSDTENRERKDSEENYKRYLEGEFAEFIVK